MEVCFVLIRVKNLHFVALHEKDTAVTTALAFSFDYRRRGPFDV